MLRKTSAQYVVPAHLVRFYGVDAIRQIAKGFKADLRAAGLPLNRKSFNGFIEYLEAGFDEAIRVGWD